MTTPGEHRFRDDEIEHVAHAIRRGRFERTRRLAIYDPTALDDNDRDDARAALAAMSRVAAGRDEVIRECKEAVESLYLGTTGGAILDADTIDAAVNQIDGLDSLQPQPASPSPAAAPAPGEEAQNPCCNGCNGTGKIFAWPGLNDTVKCSECNGIGRAPTPEQRDKLLGEQIFDLYTTIARLEIDLASLKRLEEAAREYLKRNRYVLTKDCIDPIEIGVGNRLADALAALDREGAGE